MTWIDKSRKLLDQLEGKAHPGVRVRLIREAKNRISEYAGEFSLKRMCERLVEEGALDGSDQARRAYKQFEKGARKFRLDQEPVPTVLSLLEVTPELAGYQSEDGPPEDTGGSPAVVSGDGSGGGRTKRHKVRPLTLKIHNNLEDPMTVLALRVGDELELHISHGDSRSDQSVLEGKMDEGAEVKEIWVRGLLKKFAADPDSKQEMPGKSKAVFK